MFPASAIGGRGKAAQGGGMMGLHILLVGDEADHADAMRRALVRMEAGVRVTTAARLERALEALRDPAIRCVVTDVRLPDADGVRVLQALRSARRELPVIVVTANGSEELAVAAMKLGDRKSTRLNSNHLVISYAVFCLKKKKKHADGAVFNAS